MTNADPAPERGGTIPQAARAAQSQLAASAGAPTPQAALERYASRYVNWTAQTVTSVQRQLAAISLGQARAQALQAAASYAHDRALNASRVANHGSVISIARGHGAAASLVGDRHPRADNRHRRLHRPAGNRPRHLRPTPAHPQRMDRQPMVTAKLASRQLALAAGAVIALTALGALLSSIDPRLAGTTRPHATLTGSLGDALSILQNNARVLAAPFLLWLLGFPASRTGRLAGDILVALLAAASAVPVGLELGRWHARLLPFLPQLPLEWAALAVAISAWLAARHNHAHPSQLALLAALTLALLAAAAALETWATPHRQTRPADNRARIGQSPRPPCTVGAWRLPSRRILRRRRATRFKVARSLPLTALGSARPPGRRCPGYVNHQTPTRRDHMNSVQLIGSSHRRTRAPRPQRHPSRTAAPRGPAPARQGRRGPRRRLRRRDRLRPPGADLRAVPREGPQGRRRGAPAPLRMGDRGRLPPPEARGHRPQRRVPRPQAQRRPATRTRADDRVNQGG